MRLETYLRRTFIVVSILAALGPGIGVVGLMRARAFAKTFTRYGPLPEIPISWIDWMVLGSAIALLIAAILEVARFRGAAPLALVSTILLWIYFGPGLWAHLGGDVFFEPSPGHATSVPWQQFVYQIAATICTATLTYVRYNVPKPGRRPTAQRFCA